jgi:hypothetical protein
MDGSYFFPKWWESNPGFSDSVAEVLNGSDLLPFM